MSELSGINLIVAALDLSVVKLLRGAMRAADIGAGKHLGLGAHGPIPGTRDTYEPTPRFEPRKVIHPTPRFEPRPVHRPEPKFEAPPLPRCPEPVCPERPPKVCPSPIVPVWKTLPNIEATPSVQDIKVHIVRPDIRHKGNLIDTVI